MDRPAVLAVVSPYIDPVRTAILGGYAQVEAMIPANLRIAMAPARAKMVSCAVLSLLELHFGKDPKRSARIVDKVDEHDLRYLYIEGGELDVGLRFKKLDSHLRAYQHKSVLQDDLRTHRCFPLMEKQVAHLFVGYQQSRGLEPAIESIWITCEGPSSLDWKHCIWNVSLGIEPIQEYQSDFLPQEPKIKPKEQKRKKAEGENR